MFANFRFRRILPALLLLYSLGVLLTIALQPSLFQWDFKTYYSAAVAFLKGMDPYSLDVLNEVSASTLQFKYVYPPLTLWAFAPFSVFPYQASSTLFLLLKAATLVLLVRVWIKHFLPQDAGILFFFFCLLAFNSTLYRDFAAGNISVFEQLILWSAFYVFLKEKYVAFCGLILAAASFKLTPLIFIGLLWCTDHPRRHFYVLGSVVLFAFSQLLTFLVSPALFSHFVDNLNQHAGKGFVNPSTLTFITAGLESLERTFDFQAPSYASFLLYSLAVVFVLFVAFGSIRRHIPLKDIETKKLVLFFCIVTYALILPRFKDYSYVLLLVPAFVVLMRSLVRPALLLTLFFMIPFSSTLPGTEFSFSLAKYSSLIQAFVVFLFSVLELRAGEGQITTSK